MLKIGILFKIINIIDIYEIRHRQFEKFKIDKYSVNREFKNYALKFKKYSTDPLTPTTHFNRR